MVEGHGPVVMGLSQDADGGSGLPFFPLLFRGGARGGGDAASIARAANFCEVAGTTPNPLL